MRYYTPSKDIPLNTDPTMNTDGITRTYGLVYHVLPWLSLTYNNSMNFQPVTTSSWPNAMGVPAPNATGKTEEYGVRFFLMKGKLSVGVNRFETSANDQARTANGYVNNARSILTRLRTRYRDAGDSHFAGMADQNAYPIDTGNVSDTWSYVAEGYELRLTFNPSPNWRIMLTASKNENTMGPHLRALGAYLYTEQPYQGLPTWRYYVGELRKIAAGGISTAFDLDPVNPVDAARAAEDATWIETYANSQEKVYLDELTGEGITTSQNGKYAINGVLTHVFSRNTFLKGWSVGGNFRWRSSNIVGYERFVDDTGRPNGLYDRTRPIKGNNFLDVGAMLSYQCRILKNVNMRIQLNVENLFNWNDARLVGVDYDTQGVYGETDALVAIRWELRRPRNYVLTAKFDF
jgi:hypothetical protein